MSSSVVRDVIDAELAKLTRVVETPAGPFGYGADLSCASDLAATMDEVDGASTRGLAQALVRRLDCPRGALPDDEDYGIDLKAYCNRGTPAAELVTLARRIRAELTKDDRVDGLTVVVTPAADGTALDVAVRVTPHDGAAPFTLTLAVTSASVVLAEIG